MSFYIENFMPGTVDTPSIATIKLPSGSSFQGLLANDLSVQLSNSWGNLLPGVEMLSEIAQAVGAVNIPAWIGASVQGWRGTSPIKFSLELFLVNYKPHLDYEKKLKELAKLATVSRSSRGGPSGHWTQQIHGGYSTTASAFASNLQFLDRGNNGMLSYLKNKIDGNLEASEVTRAENMQALGSAIWDGKGGSARFPGTLELKVGTRFELRELILTNISITSSSVEVYSPSVGEKPKPLYYKVSMGLMTCRTALYSDVDLMIK